LLLLALVYISILTTIVNQHHIFSFTVAKAVFEDVSIYGLNLSAWAQADKAGFQAAINIVAKLIHDKVITIPTGQTFPHTDFLKAISVAQEGKAAVLSF
jgi:hypothetical protein